jgi:Zn-dependent protease
MDTLSSNIFLYIVIVVSATFHEYMHGWMAYRLGDPTAKNEGRLTLNPLAHIDPIGTVLLPILFMFSGGGFIGWAKPVPYNPHFLRDPKYGSLKVAAAGPGANLVIAVFLGLLFRLGGIIPAVGALGGEFFFLLAIIIYVNISLMLFNLIPLPPLDGSKIFADLFPRQWRAVMSMGFFGVLLALFIAFYFLGPLASLIFWAITGQNF